MFDGLKEKLGRFRKDVEETADEKAEAAAEEADLDEEAAAAALEDVPAEDVPDGDVGDGDASDGAAVDADDETAAVDAGDGAAAGGSAPAAGETGADELEPEPGEPGPDELEPEPGEPGPDDPGTATEGASEPADESDLAVPEDAELEEVEELGAENAREALAAAGKQKKRGGALRKAAALATGKVVIEEEDLEEPLWDLEMALLESDVEMNVAEEILDTIREKMIGESRAQVTSTGQLVGEALSDALLEVISVGQFDFEERIAEAEPPVVIIFTGVNGVGKTTSIAKMSRYLQGRGYSTILANGDTYRAGANEQIRKHADNLGRKLISHEQGGDPAAVLYDAVEYAKANDVDVVLGDTAGRLHTSTDLMAQLEKIDRVVGPDMTLFVDEAVAGQDAVQRAKKFDDAAEIDGAILTKADADSQGGAAISIAYVTGKPILFLGTGQGYDDLTRFDPEALVADLLGED